MTANAVRYDCAPFAPVPRRPDSGLQGNTVDRPISVWTCAGHTVCHGCSAAGHQALKHHAAGNFEVEQEGRNGISKEFVSPPDWQAANSCFVCSRQPELEFQARDAEKFKSLFGGTASTTEQDMTVTGCVGGSTKTGIMGMKTPRVRMESGAFRLKVQ